MKNRRGFTLIELMGVIIVFGILLLVAVPSIIELLESSETKKGEELANILELAAETYVEQNRDLFPELENIGAKAFIRVGTLKDTQLIATNTTGVNNEDIDNFTVIASKENDDIITYKYVNMDSDISGYVKDNLVLHYDGYHIPNGDIWEDLSGNGNHGTLVNFTYPLEYTNSIVFDGIDDYINSGNNSSLNITGDITLSVTFKITSDVFTGGLMIKGLNGGWATNAYVLREDYDNIIFNIADGTTNNRGYYEDLATNRWINITAVADGDKLTGYVNGIYVGAADRTIGDMVVTSNPLILGMGYNYTTFFKGQIGSAVIYNRALTSSEVKTNFAIEKNRFDI